MARERYKSHGDFVGFQLDLGRDRVAVFKKKKPGKALLKTSKSRIETAALAFLEGRQLQDPHDVVLSPAIAIYLGTAAHMLKLITDMWRNLRPRNSWGYEAAYLHNVDHMSPLMMPNIPPETALQVLDILRHSGVPMHYTSGERYVRDRRSVYGIIGREVLKLLKYSPPFTDGVSIDADLFPVPNPRIFNEAWEQKEADRKFMHIVENIFQYDEKYSKPFDGTTSRRTLVTARELRISTIVPELPAVFSARVDYVRFGYQDPGENHRPKNIDTTYEWKTGAPPPDKLIPVTELCDYVINQILACMPRDVLPKRNVYPADHALDHTNTTTAAINHYVGFGTNPAWQQTFGSDAYPLNENRNEAVSKKILFIQTLNKIIEERPDLLPLFR